MNEVVKRPAVRLWELSAEHSENAEAMQERRESDSESMAVHTYDNQVTLRFPALSVNEGFARMTTAAFVTRLDPTLEELSDLKTAVSEAVTNSIIHGYRKKEGEIRMFLACKDMTVYVEIEDYGEGIPDVEKAREPMFTTKPQEERSGMGFSFMEAFTDSLEVISTVGIGTLIRMSKTIRS